MTDTTRRQLITGIGSGLIVGLAGCNSGASSSSGKTGDSTGDSESEPNGDDSSNNNIFAGFSFKEFTLNISLGTTDGYDQIVAFRDGKQFSSTDVPPSAEKVTLDFSDYSPGDYRFAAINSKDDSVIMETTESFEPNINFEWKTASETDVYSPENDVSIATPVLEIENAGSGPDHLNWAAYESETFEPAYTRPSNENTTSISELHSPKSQRDYPDVQFKRDIELPAVLPADSKEQFIDMRNVISKPLHIPYFSDDKKELGWAVQEGTEYDVTVTIGTEHSGEQSSTETVVWETIAQRDTLEAQPDDALIITESA